MNETKEACKHELDVILIRKFHSDGSKLRRRCPYSSFQKFERYAVRHRVSLLGGLLILSGAPITFDSTMEESPVT